MRLIDSDRLKEVFERNTGYDYHDLIDIAPTIEERPHGEWIVDKIFGTVKCPKCSCEIVPNNMLNGEANFCPNCGASMQANDRQVTGKLKTTLSV